MITDLSANVSGYHIFSLSIHSKTSSTVYDYMAINSGSSSPGIRLRNDLYCVGWGVKLYSLTLALEAGPVSLGSCASNGLTQGFSKAGCVR